MWHLVRIPGGDMLRQRVVSFNLVIKVRPCLRRFLRKLTNAVRHYFQISYTELHTYRTINVKSAGINSFTPQKCCFRCGRFSRDSKSRDRFLWASSCIILSKAERNAESERKISFTPLSKVCVSLFRFSQNPVTAAQCHMELLHTEFHLNRSINMEIRSVIWRYSIPNFI
jgi:hypothetical protein